MTWINITSDFNPEILPKRPNGTFSMDLLVWNVSRNQSMIVVYDFESEYFRNEINGFEFFLPLHFSHYLIIETPI